MARVKIPVSFSYTSNPGGTTPTYVSSSSGSYVSQAADVVEPVQNTTVSVTVRGTGAPTTVYQTETSGATYTTLSTDASGNVPGWVNEGSYTITAAAVGAFAGATYYFDAVRGDGVSNIAAGAVSSAALATGAVIAPAIAAGAVTTPALSSALQTAVTAAGTALQKADNLASVASAASSRLNLGIASGRGTVTFHGSSTSDTATVAHGLSGTPTIYIATVNAGGSLLYDVAMVAVNVDATNVYWQAASTNGDTTVAGTVIFSWIAIH